MSKIKKKACPKVHLLEAYVSNQQLSRSDRQKVAHHINTCPRCRAVASELNQYYIILDQEKRKPVSHQVFKLVGDIEKDRIIIAGILLKPYDLRKKEPALIYQAEVVLTTQNNSAADLDDLVCIPIEENEIFIRAIQSLATKETTLFLYANDQKLFRKVQLRMESSDIEFLSDDMGKIELGQLDIDSLNEQHIFITTENY